MKYRLSVSYDERLGIPGIGTEALILQAVDDDGRVQELVSKTNRPLGGVDFIDMLRDLIAQVEIDGGVR